jgi:hypothetical protein
LTYSFGVGIRSKRFALVVDKGVVSSVLTDDGMDTCQATSATNVLSMLKSQQQVGSADGSEDESSVVAMGIGLLAVAAAALAFMGGDTSAPTSSTPTAMEKTVKQSKAQQIPSKSKFRMSLLDEYKD